MGMAAAAAWEVLAKAANLAQVSGLHAAMLVAVLTALLRVYHSNRRDCTRLDRCHRRLHALLQWPASDIALLLCSESGMGDPFGKVLGDAAGLVDSYKKSTLWRRVRSGGRMATKLRDMQDVVDSYCGLLLFLNAHLLLQQQQATHHRRHPIIRAPSDATVHEANDTSQNASAQEVAGTQRATDIGQGGVGEDTDPATGHERNVTADLLPIVISRA